MRYVKILSLPNDREKLEKYIQVHSKEHHWREVREGIRQVGIQEMELYIHGNQAVMIIDAPDDLDLDAAFARLATLPRQAEWEAHVAQLQGCDPNATSDQKWQLMERFFHLYE